MSDDQDTISQLMDSLQRVVLEARSGGDEALCKRSAGELITRIRIERRMNPQQFANALGVARLTVERWEKGSFLPQDSHLRNLRETLLTTDTDGSDESWAARDLDYLRGLWELASDVWIGKIGRPFLASSDEQIRDSIVRGTQRDKDPTTFHYVFPESFHDAIRTCIALADHLSYCGHGGRHLKFHPYKLDEYPKLLRDIPSSDYAASPELSNSPSLPLVPSTFYASWVVVEFRQSHHDAIGKYMAFIEAPMRRIKGASTDPLHLGEEESVSGYKLAYIEIPVPIHSSWWPVCSEFLDSIKVPLEGLKLLIK